MQLMLWHGLLWLNEPGGPYAFCPDHRKRLDLADEDGQLFSQDTKVPPPHMWLICPEDEKAFQIPHNDYELYQRRFRATQESKALKEADIVDLDGFQVPIAKGTPPEKDDEYWVEARINDTRRGKQVVVYAGKKGGTDKTQIFIDPEHDKITFDQNNMVTVQADLRSECSIEA